MYFLVFGMYIKSNSYIHICTYMCMHTTAYTSYVCSQFPQSSSVLHIFLSLVFLYIFALSLYIFLLFEQSITHFLPFLFCRFSFLRFPSKVIHSFFSDLSQHRTPAKRQLASHQHHLQRHRHIYLVFLRHFLSLRYALFPLSRHRSNYDFEPIKK